MILIGIGGNLPAPDGASPLANCQRAAAALDALPGLRLHGLSRWYLSAPIPPSGQPDYINAIAHLEGEADPALLLAALQAIEAAGGRERSVPNAARSLDLDIIAMNGLLRSTPDPILPHPRAHQRGFVLLPLADVAPNWVHPLLGQSVTALIAGLPAQTLRPLTPA